MLRPMIDARHRWVFPDPIRLAPDFRAAARELGLGTFAAAVLARRGVDDVAGLTGFLGPATDGLNDPHLLPDAAALVARVASRPRARGARHGLRGLRRGRPVGPGAAGPRPAPAGLDVVPYVPSRVEEGHGISMAAVAAASEAGVTLIMTVDTGSTSVAEVAAAARPRDRRGDHGPSPPARCAAGRGGPGQPAPGRFRLPGPRALGERRCLHRRAAAPGRSHRRGGGRARAGRPRHDRDRLGRRADPGREPGDRPPRPRPHAHRAAARVSPPSSRGRGSTRRPWTWRPSASCSRPGSTPPGGWGRPWTPPASCWPRRRRKPRRWRRPSRPPTRRAGT